MTTHVATRVLERIVDAARLAPSIFNTQPWTWYERDGTLELWADRTRALPVTDPDGRLLAISCGAALHHAVVAAGAMALEPLVELDVDHSRPDLLARLHLSQGRRRQDAELFGAIPQRCTDRRRFTAWPIAPERIDRLVAEAAPWGAAGIPVNDAAMRRRLELMLERARVVGALDEARVAETARWVEHSPLDGIPLSTLPAPGTRPGEHVNRFVDGHPVEIDLELIPSDGLVVVATTVDDQLSWLAAGQTLSAIWLRATLEGISVVPLSQVVEYAPTRELLRTELPIGRIDPQIAIRLGWQEIGRSTLARTPRRPLHEVLAVSDPAASGTKFPGPRD